LFEKDIKSKIQVVEKRLVNIYSHKFLDEKFFEDRAKALVIQLQQYSTHNLEWIMINKLGWEKDKLAKFKDLYLES